MGEVKDIFEKKAISKEEIKKLHERVEKGELWSSYVNMEEVNRVASLPEPDDIDKAYVEWRKRNGR